VYGSLKLTLMPQYYGELLFISEGKPMIFVQNMKPLSNQEGILPLDWHYLWALSQIVVQSLLLKANSIVYF